jgi:dTDP-4-dehydrorhamnose 3,5-epimerase
MEFQALEIKDVYGIANKPKTDARGYLMRVWESGLILDNFKINQASVVNNPSKGTLRGLHFQIGAFAESKVIQCVSGKIFDVVVDLRVDSPTYRQHIAITLGPLEKYFGLFVPRGFAHGYLTLEANSTLLYFMDIKYSAEHSSGIFWADPSLGIDWPVEPEIISTRDSNFPNLT